MIFFTTPPTFAGDPLFGCPHDTPLVHHKGRLLNSLSNNKKARNFRFSLLYLLRGWHIPAQSGHSSRIFTYGLL